MMYNDQCEWLSPFSKQDIIYLKRRLMLSRNSKCEYESMSLPLNMLFESAKTILDAVELTLDLINYRKVNIDIDEAGETRVDLAGTVAENAFGVLDVSVHGEFHLNVSDPIWDPRYLFTVSSNGELIFSYITGDRNEMNVGYCQNFPPPTVFSDSIRIAVMQFVNNHNKED